MKIAIFKVTVGVGVGVGVSAYTTPLFQTLKLF